MIRAANPLLVGLCLAVCGCSNSGRQGIEYSSMDKTLGRWPAKAQPGSKASLEELPAAERDAEAGGSVENPAEEDAGAQDMSSETGSVKTPTKPDPTSSLDAGKAAPPRLTFSVLTQVQHMRVGKSDPGFDEDARGPKNMGAIWISKPDGTFVRSLEVWRLHKERARHLVTYNKACECPKPDITATATLNKHREHMASWDMTDRDGKTAPEGQYTLHIEVADYDVDNPDRLNKDAKNALWSIDFDTKSAPKTLMPEAVQYFTNLKLELFAP